jgi:hypothetical protein
MKWITPPWSWDSLRRVLEYHYFRNRYVRFSFRALLLCRCSHPPVFSKRYLRGERTRLFPHCLIFCKCSGTSRLHRESPRQQHDKSEAVVRKSRTSEPAS